MLDEAPPPETWHMATRTKLDFVGKEDIETNNTVGCDQKGSELS